jgi:hypothetical protein
MMIRRMDLLMVDRMRGYCVVLCSGVLLKRWVGFWFRVVGGHAGDKISETHKTRNALSSLLLYNFIL